MYVVTLPFLNSEIERFIADIGDYYPRLSPSFKICNSVGTRLIESIEPSRWTAFFGYYSLFTAKGSNTRIIQFSELTEESKYFINFGENYPQQRPQGIFEGTMQSYWGKREFYIGQKRSYTHIFRHLKAKNMKAGGSTDLQIKEYLGEKNLKSAQAYIYSEIYTNLPIT
jgi:hypothetical protein